VPLVISSAYDYTIAAKDKALVKTDIQIAVPSGSYGRVGEPFILAYCTAIIVSLCLESYTFTICELRLKLGLGLTLQFGYYCCLLSVDLYCLLQRRDQVLHIRTLLTSEVSVLYLSVIVLFSYCTMLTAILCK
jgi:hypothetical protein